jgi:glycosyltransferase involved in cell wall biosynthesis
MPTYNHGKYIHEAVLSVLNQSYRNIELIICDNASTDETPEIIHSISDSRIKYYRNDKNIGPGGNIDLCLSHAIGQYIAFLASDDLFAPTKLQKQIEILQTHPEVGAVLTHASVINEDGKPFEDENHFYFNIFEKTNRSREQWLNYFFYQGNCLCLPSSLVRRSVVQDIGYLDSRFVQLPDLDFWIRVCKQKEIYIIEEKLTKYRVRAGDQNISGNNLANQMRSPIEHQWVLNEFLNLDTPEAYIVIFPEIYNESATPESVEEAKFLLARHALKTKQNHLIYFAINTIFRTMQSPSVRMEIERKYNYSLNQWYEDIKTPDPFHILTLREASKALAKAKETAPHKCNLWHKVVRLLTKIKKMKDRLA